MCSVEKEELGRQLKARRAASGRTIAAVAVEAGLSVPYIANLENGRGNPTVAALTSLARALGTQLRVELPTVDEQEPESPRLPDSLVKFARLPRFRQEAGRIAEATGQPVATARDRLLAAMAGLSTVSARPLSELDWHRALDVVVLFNRA